jgi:TonB family protein
LVHPERGELGRRRWREAGAVTVALHVAVALWVLSQPFGFRFADDEVQLALRIHEPTELVAPSPDLIRQLTGRAPSEADGPAAAVGEVTLEELLAEAGPPSAPAAVAPVEALAAPLIPAPAPAPRIVEPTESEVAEAEPPVETEPSETDEEQPSDAPPAEEEPMLAFERPGPMTFSRLPSPSRPSSVAANPPPVIPPAPLPGNSVQHAIEEISRSRGGGAGLVVGDVETSSGVVEAREIPPSPGSKGSAVELLSDPEGVDFRPYLVRVLAAVRRNWQAVMPASAKLGLRGKVVIQFSVDQVGSVPKLVIAIPSGSEPLDRAAVAAISASNPFPPLPNEFSGEEVRLQLNFLYNIHR